MNNNQLAKATREDFEKRSEFEKKLSEINYIEPEHSKLNSVYLELLNSKEWNPYIIEENGKLGIKSVLGETLLPAKYDDILLRPNIISELRVVVACLNR